MDTGLANHQPVPKAKECFLVSLHCVVVCLLLREVHILSIEAFPCWFIGWPCASCGYAVRCWYHCQPFLLVGATNAPLPPVRQPGGIPTPSRPDMRLGDLHYRTCRNMVTRLPRPQLEPGVRQAGRGRGRGGGGGGRGQAQRGGGRGNGRRRPGQHAQQVVPEVYVRRFNRMVSKVFMLVRKSPKPNKCLFDS